MTWVDLNLGEYDDWNMVDIGYYRNDAEQRLHLIDGQALIFEMEDALSDELRQGDWSRRKVLAQLDVSLLNVLHRWEKLLLFKLAQVLHGDAGLYALEVLLDVLAEDHGGYGSLDILVRVSLQRFNVETVKFE